MINVVVLWTFLLVLLLLYNVELNPGPVYFPYSVCYKPVRVNQQALLCDFCTYWCHRICCGVDACTYTDFQSVGCLIGLVLDVLLILCPFMIAQF